jgi:hypothetical protein
VQFHNHLSNSVLWSVVPNSWCYHAPRLALQPVLVWWALFCSGIINWPFGKASKGE